MTTSATTGTADVALAIAEAAEQRAASSVAEMRDARAAALQAARDEAAAKLTEAQKAQEAIGQYEAAWAESIEALAAEERDRQRQAAAAEQDRDVPLVHERRAELHRKLGEAAAATVAAAHLWRDVEAFRVELAGLVGAVTSRADTWGLMRVPAGPERDELARLLWVRAGDLSLGKTANGQAAAVSRGLLGELLRIASTAPPPEVQA